MSTLVEIKLATCQLSQAEQEELLRDLAGKLQAQRTESGALSRQSWMTQLQTLRDAIGTGEPEIGGEQILEELRVERN